MSSLDAWHWTGGIVSSGLNEVLATFVLGLGLGLGLGLEFGLELDLATADLAFVPAMDCTNVESCTS